MSYEYFNYSIKKETTLKSNVIQLTAHLEESGTH